MKTHKPRYPIGIVLGAGRIDSSLVAVLGDTASALIPLNGRPSIFHVIQSFLDLGICKIYISVGYKQELVRNLVRARYEDTFLQIEFISVDWRVKPGSALLQVIAAIPDHEIRCRPLYVSLADTLVRFKKLDPPYDIDFIGTSPDYDASEPWSVAIVDRDTDSVKDIFDKEIGISNESAIVGIYYFVQPWQFRKMATDKDYEIADLLYFYMDRGRRLQNVEVEKWIDLGHLDKYYKAKKESLTPRFFNSFQHDDLIGTITKFSTNEDKLGNEARWIMSLPNRLTALAPRLIDYSFRPGNTYVEMEYYGYPTVAELWLYGRLEFPVWKSIVNKIVSIITLFREHLSPNVTMADYFEMYVSKTKQRVNQAREQSSSLDKLFDLNKLLVNGEELDGWPTISVMVDQVYERLFNPADNCLIHGDLCFSNILYDLPGGIIRLIDARGEWGRSSIWGDIKYDIAKLRHSISGDYDFIVNDLYRVELTSGDLSISVPGQDKVHGDVKTYFDQVVSAKWPLEDIKLIEGLLFISMIPLHKDFPRRQLAMFAKGMVILNDVYKSHKCSL